MATAKKTTKKKVTAVRKPSDKKNVAKTTSPKKTVTKAKKAPSKKPKLRNAPSNKYFWVNNGGVLKNLAELHDALLVMKKEQFVYHTQNGANHFAMWVDMVLMEPECAKELTKAKTQKIAAKKVQDALKKYS